MSSASSSTMLSGAYASYSAKPPIIAPPQISRGHCRRAGKSACCFYWHVAGSVQRRPAIVDPNVAALHPPKLLESLPECGDESLSFPVALGKPRQHTDPSHHVKLLRARRKWQCSRCAADNFDEIASSHCLPQPQDCVNFGL